MPWNTFVAFIAAIGLGSIIAAAIAAFVSHLTAISNFRQAWINALRDDLAEYFRALENMNHTIGLYLQDSVKYEGQRAEARIAIFFVYERIRLRLNRTEGMHAQLEKKLREFLDEPIGQAMANRTKIDEAVDLARRVLKAEWQVTKYPWKGYWTRYPPN